MIDSRIDDASPLTQRGGVRAPLLLWMFVTSGCAALSSDQVPTGIYETERSVCSGAEVSCGEPSEDALVAFIWTEGRLERRASRSELFFEQLHPDFDASRESSEGGSGSPCEHSSWGVERVPRAIEPGVFELRFRTWYRGFSDCPGSTTVDRDTTTVVRHTLLEPCPPPAFFDRDAFRCVP